MAKKIKVFLQSPIFSSLDSAYYKYLAEYPPEDVIYTDNCKRYSLITSKSTFSKKQGFKIKARALIDKFYISFPNLRFSKKGDYDLVHCAHCLSGNNKLWVVDIEAQMSFVIGAHKNFLTEYIIKRLMLSKNCKRILPWTEWAKTDIINRFKDPEINKKLKVVYPAVPCNKFKRIKHERITLLFVSRYFWAKGGLIALEVFKQLHNRYDNLEFLFISDVPVELKRKYNFIKFYDLVPQDELYRLFYPRTDIFFYPSFVDTFGFSLLEAMSFGLPIITVDNPTRREIVEDGKNGFVVNYNCIINLYNLGKNERIIIKRLVERTTLLIEQSPLRKKMGQYGLNLVKNDKFSLNYRNKQLTNIYKEALL